MHGHTLSYFQHGTPSTGLQNNEETNLTGPTATQQDKQVHLVYQLLRLMRQCMLQHAILLCCRKAIDVLICVLRSPHL